LASPRFQAFAASFLPTRTIAARRAQKAFDLAAGFVYSQILLACVELRLFEKLRTGPRSAASLAPELDLTEAATLRLLRAATALDLAEERGTDTFGLGPQGAALLGNPGALAMVEHHRLVYADLADPVALLRGQAGTTHLSRFWAYAKAQAPNEITGERVSDYSTLMAGSQTLVRGDVLDAYPLNKARFLLDVGGGEGAFLEEALRRHQGLRGAVFDLPSVAERARARFERMNLGERAQAYGGDFGVDELPSGADVISLVRVLHDHDDAIAIPLLRNIKRALAPGGLLILAEPMSREAGSKAVGDAYFGFYLMAMGSGQPRTPSRIAGMLRDAGFTRSRVIPTRRPMLTRLIEAG
jgi:demethylspheroidene O-methyltransferase